MASPLLSFAAGMGSGYLTASRQQELDEERRADRAMRKESHDSQMEEVAQQRTLRRGLADAVKPIGVTKGATMGGMTYDDAGIANSDFRQNRTMGMDAQAPQQAFTAGGKAYGNRSEADAAATAYNSPDATMGRVSNTLMATDPAKAMSLKNATLQNKVGEANFTEEQRQTLRKIQEEGYSDAARFARMGDEQGVFGAFNKNGKDKLVAVPTKTAVERDINGQKIQTFDYEGQIQGADGIARPFKVNSFDLSVKLMPYEKMLESMRKDEESKSKIGLQGAQANQASATAKYYSSRSTNEDIRDPNLKGVAGAAKADHFDEKQWDTAFSKMDKSVVSLPGADEKETVHPDLSSARRMLFNEMRSSGEMTPHEAVAAADEKIIALRNRAMEIVEADRSSNKKSTLTVQKVVSDLLRKAQAGGSPKPSPAAPKPAASGPSLADAAKAMTSPTQATNGVGEAGNRAVVDARAPNRMPNIGALLRSKLPVDEDLRKKLNASVEQ